MRNLIFICALFCSLIGHCQKTVILTNENYNQEVVEISKIGDKFLINHLPTFACCFSFEKCDLRNLLFEQVALLMKNNPNFIFEISSHTDSQGDDNYNLKLSQRIADNYKSFFIKKGISQKRIKSKGYGETQILNKCNNGIKCSHEKHRENRRLEIKIIDIKES
ncbi:MAG: OmpA family protein [Saprospiraceae bacterium]